MTGVRSAFAEVDKLQQHLLGGGSLRLGERGVDRLRSLPALRQWGSLTVWFMNEAIAAWQAEARTTLGGQPQYSRLAITGKGSGESRIHEAIAAVVPGFEEIGRIDKTKQEFHVGGRTFHTPTFATADGRASLHVHDLPELREELGVLRLMTVRSEGQFNTVVYEDHDLYRGVEGGDVILLHPQDIERLGLRGDQRVTVHSESGSMPEIRVIPFDRIRAGNAVMYYPEANILVARSLDPRSKTPAFKNVLVRVEAGLAATIR